MSPSPVVVRVIVAGLAVAHVHQDTLPGEDGIAISRGLVGREPQISSRALFAGESRVAHSDRLPMFTRAPVEPSDSHESKPALTAGQCQKHDVRCSRNGHGCADLSTGLSQFFSISSKEVVPSERTTVFYNDPAIPTGEKSARPGSCWLMVNVVDDPACSIRGQTLSDFSSDSPGRFFKSDNVASVIIGTQGDRGKTIACIFLAG
jgi:hypothetical protein